MGSVSMRLYGPLNDFVGEERQGRRFEVVIDNQPAVKDTIESVGVPHVEVELVLIDGEPAPFDAALADGAHVAVYPRFFALAIDGVSQVQVREPVPPRFVLDVHLGTLARHMGLLGIDTAWPRDADDPELAEISARESRILLTRDRGLLKRRLVELGYCVRANDPEEQIVEVSSRFDLLDHRAPFSRCLACNGRLERVDSEQLRGLVPPRVLRVHQRFARCTQCQRPYWGGTHYERLQDRVEALERRVNATRARR